MILRYIAAGTIILSFFFPLEVSAKTPEQQALEQLQQQINLLLEEVTRLQQILLEPQRSTFIKEPLSASDLRAIIKDGVMWFKNAQEANGHFGYEYLPYEDRYLNDDHIVRQAGALYALGEVASRDEENTLELKETLTKTIDFFEDLSVEGDAEGKSFRCIANSNINHHCQLGATALALTGLIETVNRYPETLSKYQALIEEYTNYLLAMKKEDAGFRGFYIPGSELTEKESSFSNGEAVLALARAYQFSPNDEIKKVIDDSFEYFTRTEFDFPLYLWIMAALKDMQLLWNKDEYIAYAKSYTDWRFNGMRYRKNTVHNFCAYTEGIVSAYSVLENSLSEEEKQEILDEINFWLTKSKSLQLDEDDMHKIVQGEQGLRFGVIKNREKAFGGFLTGETNLTQRIDFTQHCLNSYLQKLVDIDRETL